jgi:hypothetical protein
MDFADILEQTIALLQHQGRLSYGALKRRFGLDDAYLDDLKIELIEAPQLARDEHGRILVWVGQSAPAPLLASEPARSSAPSVPQGEFARARFSLEQGIVFYNPERHHALAALHGENLGVACLSFMTWALATQGEGEQGMAQIRQGFNTAALREAKALLVELV